MDGSQKYFRLSDDIHLADRWELDAVEDAHSEFDSSAFTQGKPSRSGVLIEMFAERGMPLDFTLGAVNVPVVSERLKNTIAAIVCDDVEWVPVAVNGVEERYFILNAIQVVDCLDEQHSRFTKWSESDGRPDKVGHYRMVPQLVLLADRLVGAHVVRVSKWLVPLVVSQRVKDAIVAESLRGAVFEQVT